MSEEIITREELVDAKVDVKDLGECVNGNETGIVNPRYGDPYSTLPKALEKVENIGGLISAPTLTALQAITPTYNHQVGRDDSTGNEYRWDPAATPAPAWVATGRNFTQDFQNFANANAMFKAKTYATAVDFNTLTAYGTHTILSGSAWDGSTNRPDQTSQWGHVIVLPTTANVITQIAIMGNISKTFAMRLRSDTGVWQAWGYFYSFDKIAELLKADFFSYIKPQRTSANVNLLDPTQVINGFEVRPDGTILASTTAAISGLTYCFNKDDIYVSGLQSNTAPRYYRFLNQQGVYISGGFLAGNVSEGYIKVPAGSYSFQISLKQGNSNPLDISTAQIEFGKAKTTYVAFAAGAITHLNNVALVDTPMALNTAAAGKNLFDKTTVLNGYEIYSDGRLLPQASSISSALILVKGLAHITISGLVQNPEIVRYGVFRDSASANPTVVQIDKTSTSATFTVPENATTFQFSIKQRSTSVPDLNVVQVESGTNITTYEAYIRGFNTLNGIPVATPSSASNPSIVSRAIGAKAVYAGDSRVQTSDVDNGDVTGTTYRSNYPKFQKVALQLADYKNYARSGASFAEYTGQLTWQKLRHQVQTAIDNAENPTFFMLDAGTNDMNWYRTNQDQEVPVDTLGSYETAMGKAIADLDFSKTAEAMRWCLFKIREAFPNAVCFYATQTQRADTDPVYQEISNDVMVKLARRYGFTIIDGLYGFDILKDFETWGANGRYLSDGLHPNLAGQQVMNNFYTSEIIRRMTY